MSETINLELKADPSGAKEALQQVNKSLKEGTEAAEALNHVLDGDLAGAFKSLGDLSKTLGIDLGLAFSPAEIIAFVQVIAEVADKLSKLIAGPYNPMPTVPSSFLPVAGSLGLMPIVTIA